MVETIVDVEGKRDQPSLSIVLPTTPLQLMETYGRPSSSIPAWLTLTEIERREDMPLEMRLVQMDQVASTEQQSFLPTCLHIWRPVPSQKETESMPKRTTVMGESSYWSNLPDVDWCRLK
ncbi:hypothetical protein TEQG_07152 [Trichophyton equinum CBS 127.97]|uniref:Uncharacterized protein n=1 Tax=Trichophyton equinum (strain ATCC MYA-4606 / CBS 127.97) TaxID=559882 RepID=F2Q256_TRIEC|nr:hypothetical protein TEQG_07152 [Trichophyton equinum CBS 127.97]